MFSGYGVLIGFVLLGALVVAVVAFIIRSAIKEVSSQSERRIDGDQDQSTAD
jgi:hypothetical protein